MRLIRRHHARQRVDLFHAPVFVQMVELSAVEVKVTGERYRNHNLQNVPVAPRPSSDKDHLDLKEVDRHSIDRSPHSNRSFQGTSHLESRRTTRREQNRAPILPETKRLRTTYTPDIMTKMRFSPIQICTDDAKNQYYRKIVRIILRLIAGISHYEPDVLG